VELSKEQLEKLSDLFIDIAKGLLLASLAVPAFTSVKDILSSIKLFIIGIAFIYFSLSICQQKEKFR